MTDPSERLAKIKVFIQGQYHEYRHQTKRLPDDLGLPSATFEGHEFFRKTSKWYAAIRLSVWLGELWSDLYGCPEDHREIDAIIARRLFETEKAMEARKVFPSALPEAQMLYDAQGLVLIGKVGILKEIASDAQIEACPLLFKKQSVH